MTSALVSGFEYALLILRVIRSFGYEVEES